MILRCVSKFQNPGCDASSSSVVRPAKSPPRRQLRVSRSGMPGRTGWSRRSRSTRHLSPRVASRIEAGARRRRLPGDDLQCLSSAPAIAKKKTLIASEQDRPDVVEQRTLWRASQQQIDPAKVVFIDETWAKTNMTRRYGRSPRGARVAKKLRADVGRRPRFWAPCGPRDSSLRSPSREPSTVRCSAPGSSNIWCPS